MTSGVAAEARLADTLRDALASLDDHIARHAAALAAPAIDAARADAEARVAAAESGLQRERDLTAELRRLAEARERRIGALEDALRALAAASPEALRPVMARLGVRAEPPAAGIPEIGEHHD